MSERPAKEDFHTLCDQLKKACARLGLVAESVNPTRVRVGAPGAGMLSEVITCKPDADEVLRRWWSRRAQAAQRAGRRWGCQRRRNTPETAAA